MYIEIRGIHERLGAVAPLARELGGRRHFWRRLHVARNFGVGGADLTLRRKSESKEQRAMEVERRAAEAVLLMLAKKAWLAASPRKLCSYNSCARGLSLDI